jgi:protein-S-isoprenylcysteine O-methyltransferase Ste14
MGNKDELVDRVSRVKRPSPLGSSIFVCLRSLDVFIQYRILAKGLANPLLNILHVSRISTNSAPIVVLGLPLQPLILLAMAAGSAIKHNYWQICVSEQEMPPSMGFAVGLFNMVNSTLNSIMSLTALSSYLLPSFVSSTDNSTTLPPLFILGTVSYTVGILLETISEVQRRNFKNDPKNEGKLYTGGLFSLARHINYGGYTVWRAGYALAAGGVIPGVLVAAFFGYDFISRGIPLLDRYCSERVSLHALCRESHLLISG